MFIKIIAMQSLTPSLPFGAIARMQSCAHKGCSLMQWNRQSKQNSQTAMFSIAFTVVLLLQIFTPCAAALYHLPLKKFKAQVSFHSHGGTGSHRIVQRDARSPMQNNLNGLSGDGYYIDVDIGTPLQRMQVLVDTGSANFAVASTSDPDVSHYFHTDKSSSFSDQGTEIYVPYTEGEWTGTLGTDVVSLPFAENLTTTANIACITESKAFFVADAEWQGILGLAYAELARPDSSHRPFFDSLLEANPDIENIFSIQLCGSSFVHIHEKPLMEGSLVIGGVVPSMAKSPLFYTPIYKEWYYEVVLTDIQVGNESLEMDCKEFNFDKTIVDSGTTNIRLATKVFEDVVRRIENTIQEKGVAILDSPGPMFYSGEDVICYNDMTRPFSLFPIVSFYLMQSANTSFKLDITPQHYLRPVEALLENGAMIDQSCVKFGFSPSQTGTVLGAVLLEAFYVVFDRKSSKIGFGQTSCPLPDPAHPVLHVTIGGPFESEKNYSQCAYKKPEVGEKTYLVVSYVLAGVSITVVLPLVMLFFMWTRKLAKRREGYLEQEDNSETQTVLTDS